MIRLAFLFLLLTSFSSEFAFADQLVCDMDKTNRRNSYNAPVGLESTLADSHVLAYDIVRGDCDDGYSFEMEGFGPGLAARFGETFMVSCPFVKDFRGTFAGIRVHATALLGLQAATYVGPGVCFVYGINGGIGAGASLGVLRLRHVDDKYPAQPLKKNLEVPEEMKGDMPSTEPSQADSQTYKEREFDR